MVFKTWIVVLLLGIFACGANIIDADTENRAVDRDCFWTNTGFNAAIDDMGGLYDTLLAVRFTGVTINGKRYLTNIPMSVNDVAVAPNAVEDIAKFLFQNGKKKGNKPEGAKAALRMDRDTVNNRKTLRLQAWYKNMPIDADIKYHYIMNAGNENTLQMPRKGSCISYPTFHTTYEYYYDTIEN